MKTIAIVGAGFAGLATAWYLLEQPNVEVTLIDSIGIGGGASGISAGLLHPYRSNSLELAWRGLEAFHEARRLICSVTQPTTGLLRLMTSVPPASQDIEPWSYTQCQEKVPHLRAVPGAFLRQALVVDAGAYLRGLWEHCQKKGAKLEISPIDHIDALNAFDEVVLATGWNMGAIRGIHPPPITPMKGQTLLLENEGYPLPYALQGRAYLISGAEDVLTAGATFEREFRDSTVDIATAEAYLRPRLAEFSPLLAELPVRGGRAHIRAMTASHRPFAERLTPRVICIGGLGAKGLLYHALMAKQVYTAST